MSTDTVINAERLANQGRVLLDGFGVAHDYLELFRDDVLRIAEREGGKIGYEGLGVLCSYAHRARTDVGQYLVWLDEIDAALDEMACDA